MNKSEKISVIITTNNRKEKLDKCIYSVLLQKHLPDEVLLIDNSVSKNAKSMIKKWSIKTNVKLLYYHQKKSGAPYARNLGIEKASNDLLAFIDDDCVADKNWLKEALQSQKKFAGKIIMGKNLNGFPNNVYSCAEHLLAQIAFQRQTYKEHGITYCHWLDTKNCLLKKSILLKNNIRFDKRFAPFSIYEDVDMARQLERKGVRIIRNNKMIATHYGRTKMLQYCMREIQKGKGYYHLEDKWMDINRHMGFIKKITQHDDLWKRAYLKQINTTSNITKILKKKMIKNEPPLFALTIDILVKIHRITFMGGYQLEKIYAKYLNF